MIPNPFKRTEPASLEEIIAFCANPDVVTYAVLGWRIGVSGWMTQVEYTWFKPDTEKNDEFFLSFLKWPENDLTMLWLLISVPKEYRDRCTALLWQHGLRAAEPGFVHCVLDHKGKHEFPIQGPNIIYLESDGERNVIYKNNPELLAKAREHEKTMIQPYHDAHTAWLNTVEGRLEARAYWKKSNVPGVEPEYTGPEIPDQPEAPRW